MYCIVLDVLMLIFKIVTTFKFKYITEKLNCHKNRNHLTAIMCISFILNCHLPKYGSKVSACICLKLNRCINMDIHN